MIVYGCVSLLRRESGHHACQKLRTGYFWEASHHVPAQPPSQLVTFLSCLTCNHRCESKSRRPETLQAGDTGARAKQIADFASHYFWVPYTNSSQETTTNFGSGCRTGGPSTRYEPTLEQRPDQNNAAPKRCLDSLFCYPGSRLILMDEISDYAI